MNIYRRVLPGICFLFVAFFVSFYRLGVPAIVNFDEAFYTDGVNQLLANKQFVTPYWNHQIFLDKPPLYLWVSSIGVLILGKSELGYRLISGLSLATLLLMITGLTFRKYGFIPALGVVFSLASNEILIWRGRQASTDTVLSVLIFASFFAMIWTKKWRYPLTGFILSLIYLTKSTVVLFPLLAFFIEEGVSLYTKKITFKAIHYVFFFFCVLALPSLWLALGYSQLGLNFIHFYLFATDGNASRIGPQHFNLVYLSTALRSLHLWVIPLCLGMWSILHNLQSRFFRLLLLFGFPLLVSLTFSPIVYHWYLMPSIPFWGLIIGVGIWTVLKIRDDSKIAKVLVLALILLFGSGLAYQKILPIIQSNSSYHQQQSGILIQAKTSPDTVIVRLDHNYPTVVFYSNRRILAAPPEQSSTANYFVTRQDLVKGIQNGQYTWLNGEDKDLDDILKSFPDLKVERYSATEKESVVKLLR